LAKSALEKLYKHYNRREFVHPDPLEFIYKFKNKRDKEIAGFIAASLAFGRVNQILKSLDFIFKRMGDSPYRFVVACPESRLKKLFSDFVHRFVRGNELICFLGTIRRIIKQYGSLNECFISGMPHNMQGIIYPLDIFVHKFGDCGFLLTDPSRGSASKRLNLFLRWMVRHDDVDPGCWHGISPSQLLIPLDTHMIKIGRMFGFTERKSADIKMAIEITNGFKEINREDPVKYDFVLTRFGINPLFNWEDFHRHFRQPIS